MRILIITFTDGVNPGTFMQALGVQTAFRKLYPNAHINFLKFPDFKKGKLSIRGSGDGLWNTFLQKAYAFYRLMKYNKLRKQMFRYSLPVDLFQYDDRVDAVINYYDLVVIGSDTILERAYSDKGKIGLNWMPFDVEKIYFSASASPANFSPKDDLKNIVEKALFIGLRDDLTIRFFAEKMHIDFSRMTKQPDPSYFLDISQFNLSSKLAFQIKPGYKYALYNFNSNFPYRKVLADKLRFLGYKVVSTAYNPYADICFDTVDAFEWAGVFPLMDIVVTERFHDSVFALRNCKPVIAIDWDKNRFASEGDSKTYRILEDYGLSPLHFNLSLSDDLDSICHVINEIDMYFDLRKIKICNDMQMNLSSDILDKIRKCLL
ncbi:MAG: hypothetical protein H6Q13_2639 [Bacteroidetes bacterium]|nr:hypothetical protein [Bacteroidota bacterium]